MLGLSGNQGWQSAVQNGATAGKQITLAQVAQVTPGGTPYGQTLGGLIINDTGAATVQVYDGTSTGGILRFQITLPAAGATLAIPLGLGPFTIGMFLVVSGGTAPVVTYVWK